MVKRLLLASLIAGSLGAQFTTDAVCRSCRGGVCHLVRRGKAKAAVKHAVARKSCSSCRAKRSCSSCRSCRGGVCRLVRKNHAKQPAKKAVVAKKAHKSCRRGCCRGGCCGR